MYQPISQVPPVALVLRLLDLLALSLATFFDGKVQEEYNFTTFLSYLGIFCLLSGLINDSKGLNVKSGTLPMESDNSIIFFKV